MEKGIIYVATNIFTGSQYVGQTIQKLSVRRSQHLSESKRPKGKFARNLKKFGKDAFTWEIIAENVPYIYLGDLEKWYIYKLNTLKPNGYNEKKGGNAYLRKSHRERKFNKK